MKGTFLLNEIIENKFSRRYLKKLTKKELIDVIISFKKRFHNKTYNDELRHVAKKAILKYKASLEDAAEYLNGKPEISNNGAQMVRFLFSIRNEWATGSAPKNMGKLAKRLHFSILTPLQKETIENFILRGAHNITVTQEQIDKAEDMMMAGEPLKKISYEVLLPLKDIGDFFFVGADDE